MVSGDPEELEAYRQVAEAYEAQGGGPVSLIEIEERDKLISRLATSIAAGNPPDLFLLNYRYYGQFLDAGGIAPVEDRLAASTVLDRDAFFPTSMAAFQDDGAQTCLPQNASSLVLYYNADLFEAAGSRDAARRLDVGRDGRGGARAHRRRGRRRRDRRVRPRGRPRAHPRGAVHLVQRRRGRRRRRGAHAAWR